MSIFTDAETEIINQAKNILASKLSVNSISFNEPDMVKDFLSLHLSGCEREHFSALFLDTQHRLIEYKILFSGTINACTIYEREIVKDALNVNAAAIIIAHNHPSGHSVPSTQDILATDKINALLKAMGIRLLDHMVVGKGSITSLKEEGRL